MKKAAFLTLLLLAKLPLSFLYALADGLYFMVCHVVQYRKKVVSNNLTHAFPARTPSEIHAISKRFYQNLVDWFIEIAKIPGFNAGQILKRCHIIKNDDFEDLQNESHGAVILTAHLGNWEWAGQTIGLTLDQPVNVVYKKLKSPIANAIMRYIRTAFGNEVSSMNQTARKMYRGKSRGLVTCFLADQTPTLRDAGCWPLFMNRKAPFFNGPAKIAQKLHLPVYFGKIKKVKRGYYEITIKKLCNEPQKLEASDITKQYVTLLEQTLHEQPSNWLWSHRRWKKTGKKPK